MAHGGRSPEAPPAAPVAVSRAAELLRGPLALHGSRAFVLGWARFASPEGLVRAWPWEQSVTATHITYVYLAAGVSGSLGGPFPADFGMS